MSYCDTSNNSSDWGHMTIKKPVNTYISNLNKKGEPVFVLGSMGITPWGGASGKYFKPEVSRKLIDLPLLDDREGRFAIQKRRRQEPFPPSDVAELRITLPGSATLFGTRFHG